MSKNTITLEEQTPQEPSSKGGMKMILIMLFIAGLAYVYFSEPEENAQHLTKEESDFDLSGSKEAQEKENALEELEGEPVNDRLYSEDAATAFLSKKIVILQDEISEIKSSIRGDDDQIIKQMKSMEREFGKQVDRLASELEKQKLQQIERDRNESIYRQQLQDNGYDLGGITFDSEYEEGITDDLNLSDIDSSDPFNSPKTDTIKGTNPKSNKIRQTRSHTYEQQLNYISLQLPAARIEGENYDINDPSLNPQNSLQNAAQTTTDNFSSSSNYDDYDNIEGDDISDETENETTGIKKKVAAFSFVEATPLHGVACPIGASNTSSSDGGSSPIKGQPVVIPIKGLFKTPNGHQIDVGTANLFGLCIGKRTSNTDYGRAEIIVQQISYWDGNGEPQLVEVNGYIIDERDFEKDYFGPIDKVLNATLWQRSSAAGLAAMAAGMNATQFNQTFSADSTGDQSAQSFFNGNQATASLTAGVAAIFNEIAEQYKAEAASQMDTVRVPSGAAIRFVTTTEFEVIESEDKITENALHYFTNQIYL